MKIRGTSRDTSPLKPFHKKERSREYKNSVCSQWWTAWSKYCFCQNVLCRQSRLCWQCQHLAVTAGVASASTWQWWLVVVSPPPSELDNDRQISSCQRGACARQTRSSSVSETRWWHVGLERNAGVTSAWSELPRDRTDVNTRHTRGAWF